MVSNRQITNSLKSRSTQSGFSIRPAYSPIEIRLGKNGKVDGAVIRTTCKKERDMESFLYTYLIGILSNLTTMIIGYIFRSASENTNQPLSRGDDNRSFPFMELLTYLFFIEGALLLSLVLAYRLLDLARNEVTPFFVVLSLSFYWISSTILSIIVLHSDHSSDKSNSRENPRTKLFLHITLLKLGMSLFIIAASYLVGDYFIGYLMGGAVIMLPLVDMISAVEIYT